MPTQQEILGPVLSVLEEGGAMEARDVCEAVAQKLNVAPEIRQLSQRFANGRSSNLFDRKVRWTRQNAVVANLIPRGERGVWELTDLGHKTLRMSKPGLVFVVARTDEGLVLWGRAMSAMGFVEKGSLQLSFFSPPYPLVSQREYGGWEPEYYLDTLQEHIEKMVPLIGEDGSIVMNLCDVYTQGDPILNTYQEELVVRLKQSGLFLAGKEVWINPGKPKTTPWVTKNRARLANGFETLYWWSPSRRPKANTAALLEPYSKRFLKTLERGGEVRTKLSGSRQLHPGKPRYAKNNGGKIPFNFTIKGAAAPTKRYRQYCEAAGVEIHPARMPLSLAEKYILLTTDEQDVVADFMGGSLTTMTAALRHKRRCVTSEAVIDYLQGGCANICDFPGFEEYFGGFAELAQPGLGFQTPEATLAIGL